MGITRTKIAAGLLAPILVWTLTGPVQAAELQGFAELCADKPQICFWHKAIVAPPKGWVEDPHWTKRYKAMTMFENGDQSASKPTMYLRTHPGATEISLDDYIRGAQEGWRKVVTDTSIEPLPDFERPGKPTIKVFLYKNPSVKNQEFELTAFMKDVDRANPDQTYFFQAVLASSSRDELERVKAAFYELLGNM